MDRWIDGLYDYVIISNKPMFILNSKSLGSLDSLKGVSALKPQFCPDLTSTTVGKGAFWTMVSGAPREAARQRGMKKIVTLGGRGYWIRSRFASHKLNSCSTLQMDMIMSQKFWLARDVCQLLSKQPAQYSNFDPWPHDDPPIFQGLENLSDES